MTMLKSREDLLGPRDALTKPWGRPRYLESSQYVEDEHISVISIPSEDLQSNGDDEIEAVQAVQPIVQDIKPPRQSSRQSSYSSTRSASIWSVQSVLSAITTPSSSRRGSQIDRLKSINSSVQTLSSKSSSVPQEIILCIIQHLRDLHESSKSTTCSSCFNHDAFNLALVSRAWDKATRIELYRHIHIDGLDNSKRSSKQNTRLKLLRRTLRNRTVLAQAVQELRVWNIQDVYKTQIQDQIASVIMACPNLELFTGSQSFYTHEFSRIHHALSTREHLRSHLWVIGAAASANANSDLNRKVQFLQLHTRWTGLQSLALRCQRDAHIDPGVFLSLTQLLPSLENLSISGFDEDSFNDESLLALKPLRSLRLADLSGITDNGLSRFSNTREAKRLNSLTLISLHIASLYTIARLLSNLNLTTFTFTHFRSLTIPADDLIFQPLLASRSLESLHWDLPLINSELHPSTAHLASSIKYHGFPSLQQLRCPVDTDDGAMQSLCKPQLLPESIPHYPASQISGSTLRAARLRAVARSAAGSRGEYCPGIKIKCTDPDGYTEGLLTANWLGYVAHDRNIEYVLNSDIGPWEQRKILVEEGDLLGDVADSGSGSGNGCKGNGSRRHVERARWRAADIETLF